MGLLVERIKAATEAIRQLEAEYPGITQDVASLDPWVTGQVPLLASEED